MSEEKLLTLNLRRAEAVIVAGTLAYVVQQYDRFGLGDTNLAIEMKTLLNRIAAEGTEAFDVENN